ncbi:hypothetical protein DES40_2035 [Litorimonas taeanensis]|uniref:Uncharacterized protein n=1 Tax=Litorimonas taeanensis TaxID=568099 RepID=A0A420WE20_9PROT|nr:hypothetical protein DES40_2035 [Litorimonas taeanensis]
MPTVILSFIPCFSRKAMLDSARASSYGTPLEFRCLLIWALGRMDNIYISLFYAPWRLK